MVEQLSVLQLYLLVGLCRLERKQLERHNFEAVFYEYTALRRSNDDRCEKFARAAALRAFEVRLALSKEVGPAVPRVQQLWIFSGALGLRIRANCQGGPSTGNLIGVSARAAVAQLPRGLGPLSFSALGTQSGNGSTHAQLCHL